jgi:hypothetical protein
MANTTIAFGVAFIVLGVAGYVGSGMASPTALIPAAFGVVFCILGALARDENKRKHAMHAAALLGLLAVLGSARGLARIGAVLSGEPVERPAAVIAQSIMALLGIVFVALCIRSFRDARRSRVAM